MYARKSNMKRKMLFLCFITAPVVADDIADMGEITVTATKSVQAIRNIPATVSVINRRDIEISGARTVDQLLNRSPGVYAARMDVSAPNRIAQAYTRGMPGSGRTLVLIDGVPMNSQFDGQVDWSQLSTKDVERVEIVRGVGSGLYGSNAMGGVINIITRMPQEGSTATLSTEAGSHNTKSFAADIRGRKDALGYAVSGSRITSDGYNMWTDAQKSLYGPFSNKLIAMGTEKTNFSGKLTYDVDDANFLDFTASYVDDIATGFYDVPDYQPEQRKQWLTSLKHQHFEDDYETSLMVYGRFGKRYADTTSPPFTAISSESTYDDVSIGINTHAIFTLNEANRLTLGADYIDGSMDVITDRYTSQQQRKGYVTKLGLFVQNELALNESTVINAAARLDRWATHGSQTDTLAGQPEGDYPERDGTVFSPKLSMLYRLTRQTNLRGSVGKAFKLPELFEFYSSSKRGPTTYWGNPNLKPETVLGYEVALDHYFDNQNYIKSTIYINDAEDFVYSVRRDALNFDKVNIDGVRTRGLEIEAAYNPTTNLKLTAAYTYNESEITKHTQDPSLVGNQLTTVPDHHLNLKAEYELQHGTTILASAEYVGDRYANDRNTDTYAHYTIYDLGLQHNFSKTLSAKIGVHNITDEVYEGIGYIAPGRVITAGLKAAF